MSTQEVSEPSSSAPVLPPGFRTIEDIQGLPSDNIRAGEMVSVIGFIKDYQPPIRTKGPDYKCTLEIKDHSVQYMSSGLKIIIFWPLEKMPKIQGVSDVVIIRNVKTQMWSGVISLLANLASEFHCLPASGIPRTLSPNTTVPWQSIPLSKSRQPTTVETAHVIWANGRVGELALPAADDFQDRSRTAMNVKEKFSLLKDVKPERFYDIMGEVIKIYVGPSGAVTLYISDYTANTLFYNHVWGNGTTSETRDGDEFGYIKSRPKVVKEWPGPYGKTSIQLTLYDGHADFVRDEKVQPKQWVLLKNVQINFGKMGGCLEGFLRGDRNGFEGKTQVTIMEHSDDPEESDARWKEAVRRKRDWWKKFEKQKEDMLDEAAGLGDKRKRNGEDGIKKNSKQRRQERRAAAEGKVANARVKVTKKLDLNENVRCSHPDQSPLPLHVILKRPKAFLGTESTREVILPFDVCKYRANVRVVGYFPNKIEDFAVGHRVSEFDMLSDYSGGEDTDPEEDRRIFRDGKGFAKKYEWRFALEVEDADPQSTGERMWLLVDNHSAQGLLSMDATNLRGDQDSLRQLKEQLCILWGNLEEHRSAALQQQTGGNPNSSTPPSLGPESSDPRPWRKAGEQPDLDSEEENETSQLDSGAAVSGQKSLGELDAFNAKSQMSIPTVSNKAFNCCIKQYGVKVKEDDPSKANAGNGTKWKRMFGLFGTRIV